MMVCQARGGITAGLDSKVTKKLITALPPFIEVDEIHTSVADCCNRVKQGEPV